MAWPWSNPYDKLIDDLERSWGLSAPTARAAATLITWLEHYRIPFKLTSGRRSTEKQAQLYAARAYNRNPVAPPGHSAHERGEAFDAVFPLQYWPAVQYLSSAAGLSWAGWKDPVHFTLRR